VKLRWNTTNTFDVSDTVISGISRVVAIHPVLVLRTYTISAFRRIVFWKANIPTAVSLMR
jgi:Na+-translocating ferredoxin:NAD+ oxidoreductase RnfE subunit